MRLALMIASVLFVCSFLCAQDSRPEALSTVEVPLPADTDLNWDIPVSAGDQLLRKAWDKAGRQTLWRVRKGSFERVPLVDGNPLPGDEFLVSPLDGPALVFGREKDAKQWTCYAISDQGAKRVCEHPLHFDNSAESFSNFASNHGRPAIEYIGGRAFLVEISGYFEGQPDLPKKRAHVLVGNKWTPVVDETGEVVDSIVGQICTYPDGTTWANSYMNERARSGRVVIDGHVAREMTDPQLSLDGYDSARALHIPGGRLYVMSKNGSGDVVESQKLAIRNGDKLNWLTTTEGAAVEGKGMHFAWKTGDEFLFVATGSHDREQDRVNGAFHWKDGTLRKLKVDAGVDLEKWGLNTSSAGSWGVWGLSNRPRCMFHPLCMKLVGQSVYRTLLVDDDTLRWAADATGAPMERETPGEYEFLDDCCLWADAWKAEGTYLLRPKGSVEIRLPQNATIVASGFAHWARRKGLQVGEQVFIAYKAGAFIRHGLVTRHGSVIPVSAGPEATAFVAALEHEGELMLFTNTSKPPGGVLRRVPGK